jgi:hypothetical protein
MQSKEMSEMSLPWFRFYSETIGDRKFIKAARLCKMNKIEIIGAWAVLLCAVNDSPVRGSLYVTELERYSNDDVADLLELNIEQTELILKTFIKMDMLEIIDGAYAVKNWGKRQFSSDSSAERVRKHRSNADETLQNSYSNGDVTPPDTDTDTDTEIETDIDREKEEGPDFIPSTSPSAQCEKIWIEVTGQMCIPLTNRNDVIDAIQAIIRKEEKNTVNYLKDPYYKEFIKRYPNSTGVFWCTEWAVTGKIPDQKNGKQKESLEERLVRLDMEAAK